ncbi:hypothetical protein H0H92_009775 [Tricholoma furcatifolium]|nr:hypothetical protein H0H92_009775 [Tricholoma furcatifolium]
MALCIAYLLFGIFTLPALVRAHPLEPTRTLVRHDDRTLAAPHCFPALGFIMPSNVPASLDDWWCDPHTEYAFVGFSYEVTQCQSQAALKSDFLDIRKRFDGRYVRLYGFCDRQGFYNDVVEAAWHAGIGVHALIWFGFDGGTEWMRRRDELFAILHSNPKAKFVTRVVQFGSEPLFDKVLSPSALTDQVNAAKEKLASLRISVTVSDLAYSFQESGGSEVLRAVDSINAHILPFFSTKASKDLEYFISQAQGKKIWFSQPSSPSAVANVQNERDYYNLLDSHCADLKAVPGGGVGWFAHIYSDDQEVGYGIYDASETSLKFSFAPRTSC